MIIDGKKIADEIQKEIQHTVHEIPGRKPCLAVVLAGDHAPSQIYVNKKIQACEKVGILSIKRELPPTISEKSLLQEIGQLNDDSSVDGILVQLPLPPHIDPFTIAQSVQPEKDVDGFHPTNIGKLLLGQTDGFAPCTPMGIQVLLERLEVDVTGKHALVIGRSNIVGKPMAAMLMQAASGGNATVTVAHRHTQNMQALCLLADIIIVAIGKPRFLTADMVKENAVVIDVGINQLKNPTKKKGYQIVGDVDFENIKDKCAHITPVPGGVGPMTIAMLLKNTLKSYLRRK